MNKGDRLESLLVKLKATIDEQDPKKNYNKIIGLCSKIKKLTSTISEKDQKALRDAGFMDNISQIIKNTKESVNENITGTVEEIKKEKC